MISISSIILLVVLAVCFYLLLKFVPIASPFREVIIALVAIALIIWLLGAFGVINHPIIVR